MKQDAENYVKRCDRYQRYAPIPHVTSKALNPVTSHWLVTQYGMDIVEPLPITIAQKKFLLVVINYFNKWVETKVYVSIKEKDVSKFIWKNIVCWYGVSQAIVIENEPQFNSIVFQTFCSELNIKNIYSTPRYPQSNEQAVATNKTLLNALKKMLQGAKGKWVDELPGVLWV